MCLLGHNGAGKSTLMRILAGVEAPDEGVVERKRGLVSMYLEQEPNLPKDATPREIVLGGLAQWHAAFERHSVVTALICDGNDDEALLHEQSELGETIERLGGWDQEHLALEMLEKMGVRDVDRAVGTMSGGEQRRVALARILVAQPEFAILDEPTNHLDVDTIEYLESYLTERFKGAVLLVTHDRYVLDAVADRVVELEHSALREYTGSYSDYLEQKAELLAHAERGEAEPPKPAAPRACVAGAGARARTTKQKARIQRATALMAIEAPRAGRTRGAERARGGRVGDGQDDSRAARRSHGARRSHADREAHAAHGARRAHRHRRARTAPARRRCSAWSRKSSRRARARSCSARAPRSRTSTRRAPGCATTGRCSRTSRIARARSTTAARRW